MGVVGVLSSKARVNPRGGGDTAASWVTRPLSLVAAVVSATAAALFRCFRSNVAEVARCLDRARYDPFGDRATHCAISFSRP